MIPAPSFKKLEKRDPRQDPRRGDRLTKIKTNRNGVRGIFSRSVISVTPPWCCDGTGLTHVRPIAPGKFPYTIRCHNGCSKKNIPDRTTVIWTRKRPDCACQCTLREWRQWARDAR